MYKQVIVIRADLEMSIGKTAVQASHVAILASDEVAEKDLDTWEAWMAEGQRKIACRVNSLDELLQVKKKAEDAGLVVSIIEDLGLTELEPGTTTAIAIGPDLASRINPVTKKLEML
jgi:PTH2 family peptidyl-tRNA hydrolase